MSTNASADTTARGLSPYQLFMLALCLWAIVSLAMDTVVTLPPETRVVLHYADNIVCALFFVDFLSNLYRAPKRWAYLISWGWIDLLSTRRSIRSAGGARPALCASCASCVG